jgi:methylmalonyl-CoA/ethylmalonyl-CoA epimerase
MGYEEVLRLHHVGYAAKAIEPVVEAYVRRYGYSVATAVIHDPVQTALVQFLKLADDSSYLEFVAPDGAESKLINAAKKGGGLNHLCYTCGPLEEAVARLEANGMRLISELRPAVAFAGRRICWLKGEDPLPIELVERRDDEDRCVPGL